MKKNILKFFATSLLFFVLITPVLAINLGVDSASGAAIKGGYSSKTTDVTLSETVGIVIKIALSMVGIVFFGLIVYAGYLWMTARGEDEPIKKAQKIILTAAIGLLITVGAYALTSYLLPRIYGAVSPSLTNMPSDQE